MSFLMDFYDFPLEWLVAVFLALSLDGLLCRVTLQKRRRSDLTVSEG